MSRRSKIRKMNDPRTYELITRYRRIYNRWKDREPSRWRIFAWLKWNSERPHKPKLVDEYYEIDKKYGYWHRWI